MADENVKVVHRYYITNQEGEITENTPFYDKIDEKSVWTSFYQVEKNGKKGLIDLQTGEIILQPIYDLIERTIYDKSAPVELILKWKDSEQKVWHGFYQIAKPTGVITRFHEIEYGLVCCMVNQFYLTQDYDVCPFHPCNRKNNLLKVRKNHKVGLMNTETCELVLDFQFGGPNTRLDIDLDTLDEDGYVRVHLNKYLGIANVKTGNVQVKEQYSDISLFNKYGLAVVFSSFKGHKTWGMIDREGKEVISATNSTEFITLGRPASIGSGWAKVGSEFGVYERSESIIFECEENDFLVGFNLQENKWYLYTKSGLSMPYPLKHLDISHQQQLTSHKKLEREILQVSGQRNTFVFPNIPEHGECARSDIKQRITLFMNGIFVETFVKEDYVYWYKETPEHRDVYFFSESSN